MPLKLARRYWGFLFVPFMVGGLTWGQNVQTQQQRPGTRFTPEETQRLAITVRVFTYVLVPRDALAEAERATSEIFRGIGINLNWVECPLTNQEALAPALSISAPLYNYAHVSGGALARSKTEAQRILAAARADSLSVDSSLAPPQFQPGASQGCARPFGGRILVVRILPGYTPAKAAFRDTVFGFAKGYSAASIFYERITDLAQGFDNADWEIPPILGAAIAHELGHLLLGSNSHSPTGIMRGQWDRSYLRLAVIGHLLFTRQQAEVIQKEVVRRNRVEVAGDRHPGR